MNWTYIDAVGNEFKIRLWCNKFDKPCNSITPEEQDQCHTYCTACTESEEY